MDGRDSGWVGEWVGGPAGDGLEYGSEALCDSFSRVFIFLCFPWLNRTAFTYGFLLFLIRPCDIHGIIVVFQIIYVKRVSVYSQSHRYFILRCSPI